MKHHATFRLLAAGFVAAVACELPAADRDLADVDHARVVGADTEPHNWLAHGRTYDEQRFSPLDQINEETIQDLGLAWSFETGHDRGHEATPLAIDGVLYLTTPWSEVIAVDASTGEQRWRFDPEVPRQWGRNACCDVVNRGVAAWKGRLYLGTLDGRLVAIDAETGAALWQVNTIDRTRPYTITGAPRVVKDKIIIGNGGAEFGVRGYVSAYDARSGELAWRFYTVPGDPSKPFEHPELEEAAKTWSGEWWEVGGGGTVWDSMAYDPELDLLYVGTGNGSPWSRYLRSPGGGDNLFLSSILALRPESGELVWHYQTTPGDTWDYTATQHIVLADLVINGVVRKVLLQAPKNSFFYVLDRATGELLSAEKYGRANWASHVDLESGRPVETPQSNWKDEPRLIYPADSGSHNWHPMSFHPELGLVFIPVMQAPFRYVPEQTLTYVPGLKNLGIDIDRFLRLAEDSPPTDPMFGSLTAWDPVRQREVWSVKHTRGYNGGVLATAGDLVFQGSALGAFSAYRADDGKKLWEVDTGNGIVAPPISYAVEGIQFVAVLVGWGGGALIGADGQIDRKNKGRLLAFKLGGSAKVEIPSPVDRAPADPPQLKASAAELEVGKLLYHRTCAYGCHGFFGVSSGLVPDLRRMSPERWNQFDAIVRGGLLQRNGMPSFADLVDQDESELMRQYLIHRATELKHAESP